jgi:phage gp36-like protein
VTYATVADLRDRLGLARLTQLTDIEDPATGVPNDAVAQRALEDASAEIDGYLIGRYALPLAAAPAVLRVHALTIAHYRLLGHTADEATQADYKATRSYLMAVAEGKVSLMPADQAPPASGAGAVLFNAGQKVMAREEA